MTRTYIFYVAWFQAIKKGAFWAPFFAFAKALTLARFEAWVCFVNYVNTAFATYYAAVLVALFCRFE
jgi:hypothetical protein